MPNEWDKKFPWQRHFPEAHEGLDVNCCKRISCLNFGVPLKKDQYYIKRIANYRKVDIKNPENQQKPYPLQLSCPICHKEFNVLDNTEIVLATDRYSVCNPQCPRCNDGVSVYSKAKYKNKSRYISYGKTHAGSKRFKCNKCNKVFTEKIDKHFRQQRRPKTTLPIFEALVNHISARTIMRIHRIGSSTYYGKVDYIYRKCREFNTYMEDKFSDPSFGMPWKLYLATDAQYYTSNWKTKPYKGNQTGEALEYSSRRNTIIYGLCTADNKTGYALALHSNYDPNPDRGTIQEQLKKIIPKYRHERKYARYRSAEDHSIDGDDPNVGKLPNKGMLLLQPYYSSSHFFYLKRLFGGNISKLRFYIDGDTTLESAFLSVFSSEIKNGLVDGFITHIAKDNIAADKILTAEVRKTLADARKKLDKENPDNTISDKELARMLLVQRVESIKSSRKLRSSKRLEDIDLHNFIPHSTETGLTVRYITDRDAYTPSHIANLVLNATNKSLSGLFISLRRGIVALDRGRQSSGNDKMFHVYGVYNPGMIEKYLEIFRTYYNFIQTPRSRRVKINGKFIHPLVPAIDRPTRAMSIGIAERRYSFRDVLDFQR